MEFGSRWGKSGFCDHDKHQTLPLPDMSGDVTGYGRCSGKDELVLSWPAYVFNHQLFLPAEDGKELHRPILVKAARKGRGASRKNSPFPCK